MKTVSQGCQTGVQIPQQKIKVDFIKRNKQLRSRQPVMTNSTQKRFKTLRGKNFQNVQFHYNMYDMEPDFDSNFVKWN